MIQTATKCSLLVTPLENDISHVTTSADREGLPLI